MTQTFERVREHGTPELLTDDATAKMAAIRAVVAEKQYRKVNGVMVDLFTASAIVAVYDALSAPNQAKLASLPIPRMAEICFSLVK